jgi:hypothetical protein
MRISVRSPSDPAAHVPLRLFKAFTPSRNTDPVGGTLPGLGPEHRIRRAGPGPTNGCGEERILLQRAIRVTGGTSSYLRHDGLGGEGILTFFPFAPKLAPEGIVRASHRELRTG